jgi:hypothetical protein
MLTTRRIGFTLMLTLHSLLSGAACSDGAAPMPRSGNYTLRTVDGRALPASYDCGESVSSGRLSITADSTALLYTTGAGGSADTREARGSYATSSDGKRLVVVNQFSGELRDTISAGTGGRLTDRAWLPVSAACAGRGITQADLGFVRD